jgi:hypothetical protein
VIAPPPDAFDAPDAGVIEEARRRQRRRWEGAAVLTAVVVAAVFLALSGGGNGSRARSGLASLAAGRPSKLTFHDGLPYVNGQPLAVGVAPTLTAGWVGLDTNALSQGGSGDAYPAPANPVIDSFADGILNRHARLVAGGIFATLVGPNVASMHVGHVGTFKPHRAIGLLPGERVFVFSRPLGSPGTVIGPGSPHHLSAKQKPALTETFYTASGKQVPATPAPSFHLTSRYWQAPSGPPADGRCAVASSRSNGLDVQWGQVVTTIAADTALIDPGFLSCLNGWDRWHGATYEVGVLLNARDPGKTPASLWNSTPVSGHPGIVEIKAVQVRRPTPSRHANQIVTLAPATLARRVGPAWLVVRYRNSIGQATRFLGALTITKLDLRPAG